MTKSKTKEILLPLDTVYSMESSQGVTNTLKISERFCSCHMPPNTWLQDFPITLPTCDTQTDYCDGDPRERP